MYIYIYIHTYIHTYTYKYATRIPALLTSCRYKMYIVPFLLPYFRVLFVFMSRRHTVLTPFQSPPLI